jgi:DNA-binding beta-propeller fold protein YncE
VTNISGYVSVINAATNSVVATVNVAGVNGGNAPRGVAINAAGTYVYVASYDPARNSGNAVSVISTATNTAVATVNLPSNDLSHPCGIAVNPTGTKVFVA